MGRYKYLAKNIGLLTISNFATKLLSFFLVPLYTSILSTADYGTTDLLSTTASVLLPILTLNVQEGVMRFALDKDSDRKAIITIGIRYLLIAFGICTAGIGVNYIFDFSQVFKTYGLYFLLMFFTQAAVAIITSYIRGIDRIADLSVSGVISSIVTISLNILFLVYLKMGIIGYILANCIGPLVRCLYLSVRSDLFRSVRLGNAYKKETKAILKYTKPMIANSVAWWVNNASDRYVVIFFCGMAANGIYSVASKIPSIMNVFQTIFNSAWALSAVKDYDPEDKSGFFANTYKAYNCMLTIVCSGIIVGDKILARILYAKDFYAAWKYVPWLTIAILFSALSGYIGGFFTAVKDSKMYATSTVAGAVTNIVLNLIFTPIMGPLGAAIATAICYAEIFVIRFVQSRRYIKLRINLKRDIASYMLLVMQSIALLCFKQRIMLYTVLIVLFLVVCMLYRREMMLVIDKVKKSRR